MKKWIIALVLILAVVVVFVACKSNDSEKTPNESKTELTNESSSETKKTEIMLDDLNGDDSGLNDIEGTFDDIENTDEGNIIYFGDGEKVTGEPTVDWDNF